MGISRSFVLLAALSACLLPATLMAQNMPATDQSQNSVDNGQNQVLVDPGVIYNNKHSGDWVGKTVTLKNVMVQDTNKSGNFWVGSDGHHRLLVTKPEDNANIKAMKFHKGDVVTVTGTIQPASKYEAGETGAEKGSMHDAENSSGVFLAANDISITSSTQH
jgi:hypothetical protein